MGHNAGLVIRRSVLVQPDQRFGQQRVVVELPRRKRPDGTHQRRVEVACDCGDVRQVDLHSITRRDNPVLMCRFCSAKVKGEQSRGVPRTTKTSTRDQRPPPAPVGVPADVLALWPGCGRVARFVNDQQARG